MRAVAGRSFTARWTSLLVVCAPRGSFGIVYRAIDRVTGEVVAVKVMDRARIKAASIEREWTVLEHLGAHPYVVQFKGSYLTAADVTFVMEMYELGSAVPFACSASSVVHHSTCFVYKPVPAVQHVRWGAV